MASAAVLKVDVALGDNGEAASVTVHDQDASKPVFHFIRGNASNLDDMKSAAKKLREILSQRPLELPKNTLKRAAFEHLQAIV